MAGDISRPDPPVGDDVYTVTEISEAITQSLETEFPAVSVMGEMANCKLHTSGHLYFTLRDESNRLDAVMFRRNTASLSFSPQDGMLVVASGRVSHYGGSGRTQIVAGRLDRAGRGPMELAFRRLLALLMEEGITAQERKRPIPPFPRRIAVLTSVSGAVIRDITDTLKRRWPVAEILHIAVDVQGGAAARSISRGFELANETEGIDVVILARGGGSIEDLWAFNLEETARAVAASRHPVITGVGHEIDTTIVDYVSDLRAATPTAAAELAAPDIEEVGQRIAGLCAKIERRFRELSAGRLQLLEYIMRSSAFPSLRHRIDRSQLRIDDSSEVMERAWRARRSDAEASVTALSHRLERGTTAIVRERGGRLSVSEGILARRSPATAAAIGELRSRTREIGIRINGAVGSRRGVLAGMLRTLAGLGPVAVLHRGYTLCSDGRDSGRIITRSAQVKRGSGLTVNFYDGKARCTVVEKKRGKPWRRN